MMVQRVSKNCPCSGQWLCVLKCLKVCGLWYYIMNVSFNLSRSLCAFNSTEGYFDENRQNMCHQNIRSFKITLTASPIDK